MDKQFYLVAPINEKAFNDLCAFCNSVEPNTHLQININSLGGAMRAAVSI